MTRRSPMWSLGIGAVVLAAWFSAVADIALTPWLRVGSAQPSLAVAWTVALALHFGSWAGLGWAMVAGLFLDILAAHPVGILTLPLILTGYAAGWAHRTVMSNRFVVPLVVGSAGALTYGILQVPIARVWGFATPWNMWFQEATLLSALYTGGWTWLSFTLLRYVHPIEPEERLFRVYRSRRHV